MVQITFPGYLLNRYVADRCLLRLTDTAGLMQEAKWVYFNANIVTFCAINQSDSVYFNVFAKTFAIFDLCHFLKTILAVFINVFYPLLSLFLKHIGTFGLLQNKLAKFRRWVITQKRTETILLRPEAASAPRKKKLRNKQRSETILYFTISEP